MSAEGLEITPTFEEVCPRWDPGTSKLELLSNRQPPGVNPDPMRLRDDALLSDGIKPGN